MPFRRPKDSSPASLLAIIEPSLDIERDVTLLGDVLSARGDVTAEAIDAAMLEKNGRRIGEQFDAADDEAPVVQIENRLVSQVLRDRASDVHIEPNEDRVRVHFRIDGALKNAISLHASLARPLVSCMKTTADMNIVERRRPRGGQFAMDVDSRTDHSGETRPCLCIAQPSRRRFNHYLPTGGASRSRTTMQRAFPRQNNRAAGQRWS